MILAAFFLELRDEHDLLRILNFRYHKYYCSTSEGVFRSFLGGGYVWEVISINKHEIYEPGGECYFESTSAKKYFI